MTTPAPTDRTWALAMVHKHLAQMREDKTDTTEGWIIDEQDLERDLVLWVSIPSKREDGTPHPDGAYLHRLEFSHSPTYPPTVEFVNPDTRQYDPVKDQKWVPLIAKSPPQQSIAFHPAYDARGQLVCHSLNYEYYIRGGHNPGPEIHWKAGTHNLVTTLMFQQKMLTEPYYGGKRP